MDEETKYEYFTNKRTDKYYVSRRFGAENNSDESSIHAGKRIISGVTEVNEFQQFYKEKGSYVIYTTPKEREEIKAVILEDPRKVISVILQRFMVKSGKPKGFSFQFGYETMQKLLKILAIAFYGDFDSEQKIHFSEFDLTGSGIIATLLNNTDERRKLVETLLTKDVTKTDLVAIGYRKEQLKVFRDMLNENPSEQEWQEFFEKNQWIFGYGLNYIFTTGLDNRKIEQTIAGFAFDSKGKRVDALLKTRGALSSICLVEIKKSDTPLLESRPYRPETWSISEDLRGGIAQIQKTSLKLMQKIIGKIELKDDYGDPTGEIVLSYIPKSFLIIGNLGEFKSSNGINEEKFSSFELFRRSISSPEILTFDELFERAKYIISDTEPTEENQLIGFGQIDNIEDNYEDDLWDEDIPF